MLNLLVWFLLIALLALVIGVVWRVIWLWQNCDLFERRADSEIRWLMDQIDHARSEIARFKPGSFADELKVMEDALAASREAVFKARLYNFKSSRAAGFLRARGIAERGSRMGPWISHSLKVVRGIPGFGFGSPPPFSWREELRDIGRWLESLIPVRLCWGAVAFATVLSLFFSMWVRALPVLLVVGAVGGALMGGIFFAAHGIGALVGLAVAAAGFTLALLLRAVVEMFR